jgi:cyclic AMP-dependent transcription factor ATF-4
VERKKAQNRTAAFRYREKKKAELDAVDMEVDQLIEKNTALKARLRDMEQELSCVKRLMVETGLGHLIQEAALPAFFE